MSGQRTFGSGRRRPDAARLRDGSKTLNIVGLPEPDDSHPGARAQTTETTTATATSSERRDPDTLLQWLVGTAAIVGTLLIVALIVRVFVARLAPDALPFMLTLALWAIPAAAGIGWSAARLSGSRRRQREAIQALYNASQWLAGSEHNAVMPRAALAQLQSVSRTLQRLSSLHDATSAMLLDRDAQLNALRAYGGLVFWETDSADRYSRIEMPARGGRAEIARLHGRFRWDDGAAPVDGDTPDWTSHRATLRAREPFTDLRVARRGYDGEPLITSESGEPRIAADGSFLGYRGVMRIDDDRQDPSSDGNDSGSMRVDIGEMESFSYTISHDLRAPLRVVEGFARIVQEDYAKSLDAMGNQHLQRIISAAQRMNSMIDALLGLANLSSQSLHLHEVNLSSLVEEAVEELRLAQPSRAVSVNITSNVVVHGDPTLLRIVIDNLVGNAWKYSATRPRASITFDAQFEPADDVELPARTVYRISDNGVGFDETFAPRMFEIFQRLHSASEYPGSGIGLATVRRIVRRHDGDIWARSTPGAGSTFCFTLWDRPVRRPAAIAGH